MNTGATCCYAADMHIRCYSHFSLAVTAYMEWHVSIAWGLARCVWCCGLKWLMGTTAPYFGEEDAHAASAKSLGIGKGVRRAPTSKASLSRCQCLVQCNAPHTVSLQLQQRAVRVGRDFCRHLLLTACRITFAQNRSRARER